MILIKKYKFIFFVFMLISQLATTQEALPIYSDYLTDNYYLLHPSMAGISNCNKVRLTGRQQWFGQEQAPNLQTLSINGRIGETSSGSWCHRCLMTKTGIIPSLERI